MTPAITLDVPVSLLRWFWNLVQTEPASFSAVLRAGLLLAEAFGLHWTPAQMAEVQMFVELLLAFLTRSATTPNTVLAKVGISTQTAVVQDPPPSPQPLEGPRP